MPIEHSIDNHRALSAMRRPCRPGLTGSSSSMGCTDTGRSTLSRKGVFTVADVRVKCRSLLVLRSSYTDVGCHNRCVAVLCKAMSRTASLATECRTSAPLEATYCDVYRIGQCSILHSHISTHRHSGFYYTISCCCAVRGTGGWASTGGEGTCMATRPRIRHSDSPCNARQYNHRSVEPHGRPCQPRTAKRTRRRRCPCVFLS